MEDTDDFTVVKRKNLYLDTTSNSPENLETLLNELNRRIEKIKESTIFEETTDLFELNKFRFGKIRCLALGSPSKETNALYQLAYLLSIKEALDVAVVSVYDPVFTELDESLFKKLNFKSVEKEDKEVEKNNNPETLYFLPHAPLVLTEKILQSDNPKILLANDVMVHCDRLTKKELHEKYSNVSLLVHSIESSSLPDEKKDDFIKVTKKRNRKKFVEPKLDYDYDKCYFKKGRMMRLRNSSSDSFWGNSFTDLALHIIE